MRQRRRPGRITNGKAANYVQDGPTRQDAAKADKQPTGNHTGRRKRPHSTSANAESRPTKRKKSGAESSHKSPQASEAVDQKSSSNKTEADSAHKPNGGAVEQHTTIKNTNLAPGSNISVDKAAAAKLSANQSHKERGTNAVKEKNSKNKKS